MAVESWKSWEPVKEASGYLLLRGGVNHGPLLLRNVCFLKFDFVRIYMNISKCNQSGNLCMYNYTSVITIRQK